MHNRNGDTMNNRLILQLFLKQLQQNRLFLSGLLSTPMTACLRDLINAQLLECANIESEISNIAGSRGWDTYELSPLARLQSCIITKYYSFRSKNDAHIAAALIIHLTKSMIHTLALLHRVKASDSRISNLFQCYLDCLESGIHLLQGFL